MRRTTGDERMCAREGKGSAVVPNLLFFLLFALQEGSGGRGLAAAVWANSQKSRPSSEGAESSAPIYHQSAELVPRGRASDKFQMLKISIFSNQHRGHQSAELVPRGGAGVGEGVFLVDKRRKKKIKKWTRRFFFSFLLFPFRSVVVDDTFFFL